MRLIPHLFLSSSVLCRTQYADSDPLQWMPRSVWKVRACASPETLRDVSSTAAHDIWHLGALVLVTTTGPYLGTTILPQSFSVPEVRLLIVLAPGFGRDVCLLGPSGP